MAAKVPVAGSNFCSGNRWDTLHPEQVPEPPANSTWPLGNSAAVCSEAVFSMLPVAMNVPAEGS